MSKKVKVLAFKDNILPRIHINPSADLIDKLKSEGEIIINPSLKHLKNLPPHLWVLDSKNQLVRKANEKEIEKINSKIIKKKAVIKEKATLRQEVIFDLYVAKKNSKLKILGKCIIVIATLYSVFIAGTKQKEILEYAQPIIEKVLIKVKGI